MKLQLLLALSAVPFSLLGRCLQSVVELLRNLPQPGALLHVLLHLLGVSLLQQSL